MISLPPRCHPESGVPPVKDPVELHADLRSHNHPFLNESRWFAEKPVRVWLLLLALFLSALNSAHAATSDERFSKANKAFTDHDYAEAAYQLRELVSAGQWSHGALHNLGNAEWKVARPGHAVLAWERARTLNPGDRNTVANLRYARTQARLVQPSRPWYEQFSEWLPPVVWLAGAAVSLWGGIVLLCLPRLLALRRAGWHQGVAALLLAVFLLSTPALAGLWTRSRIGVALEDETKLRLTPTREGEELVKIPAGEVARIERERGNYFYIRAEGDRAGWVDKRDFAKIWP